VQIDHASTGQPVQHHAEEPPRATHYEHVETSDSMSFKPMDRDSTWRTQHTTSLARSCGKGYWHSNEKSEINFCQSPCWLKVFPYCALWCHVDLNEVISKQHFHPGRMAPSEWTRSVRAVRDTPVADYSVPCVNTTHRVAYHPPIAVSPCLLALSVYTKYSLYLSHLLISLALSTIS